MLTFDYTGGAETACLPTGETERILAMATATKKTAATKRTVKTRTKGSAPAKQARAPKERQPQVNSHVEAGINVNLYDGPSSFVNGNRKTKIMLGREVAASKVTTRAQKGLYALRNTYGQKAFNPRGFDNGILRDLLGAGLITVSGGQKVTTDGHEYMVDGSQPVSVKITAAGMAYGKA